MLKKFFVPLVIFCAIIFLPEFVSAEKNSSTEFKFLRSGILMPSLPDRIRRHPRGRRPIFRNREIRPGRNQIPPARVTQRHPHKPSLIHPPSRPSPGYNQRGSFPKKRFSPPRFHNRGR